MKKWISVMILLIVLVSTAGFFLTIHYSSQVYTNSVGRVKNEISVENNGVEFSRLTSGGYQLKVFPPSSATDVEIFKCSDIDSLASKETFPWKEVAEYVPFSTDLDFYITPLNELRSVRNGEVEISQDMLKVINLNSSSHVLYSSILGVHEINGSAFLSLRVMYNYLSYQSAKIGTFFINYTEQGFSLMSKNNVTVDGIYSYTDLFMNQYGNKLYFSNNELEYSSTSGPALYFNYSYMDLETMEFTNVTTRVPEEVETRESVSTFRYFFVDDTLYYVILQESEDLNGTVMSILRNGTNEVIYSELLLDRPVFASDSLFIDVVRMSDSLYLIPFVSDYKKPGSEDNILGIFISSKRYPSTSVLTWGIEFKEINSTIYVTPLSTMGEDKVYYAATSSDTVTILQISYGSFPQTLSSVDTPLIYIPVLTLEVAILVYVTSSKWRNKVRFKT